MIRPTDSFKKSDLDKALFTTDDPFTELGLTGVQVVAAPISTMVKDGLVEFGLDNKSALRCKNMFALGLVCWLFERPLEEAMHMLQNKFAKKPVIAQANIKALTDIIMVITSMPQFLRIVSRVRKPSLDSIRT